MIRGEQTPPPPSPISTHPGHVEPGASLTGKRPNRHIRAENERRTEKEKEVSERLEEEGRAEAISVSAPRQQHSVEVRRPDSQNVKNTLTPLHHISAPHHSYHCPSPHYPTPLSSRHHSSPASSFPASCSTAPTGHRPQTDTADTATLH